MAYGLIVPNVAEVLMLQYILNCTPADDPVLRLYSNNITPDENSTYDTFTAIPGTSTTLDPGNWSINTVDGITVAEYTSPVVFTLGGPENIYGYYVSTTGGSPPTLLWAQRCFMAPVVTDSFSVIPRFNAGNMT